MIVEKAVTSVLLVPDGEYRPILRTLIRNAQVSVLANIFIVDPSPRRDKNGIIADLIEELVDSKWRGIDVRLIIGGSRRNFEIALCTQLAHQISKRLGLKVAYYSALKGPGTHSKYVIVDDSFVLIGSHNWSSDAMTNQTQDSILIRSRDLAGLLTIEFEKEWSKLVKGGDD